MAPDGVVAPPARADVAPHGGAVRAVAEVRDREEDGRLEGRGR
jgi:hypothetical protein